MLVEMTQETLIELVRERPELWDKTDISYKDRRSKYRAWDDICLHLNPDFDDLDEDDKKILCNTVMKKWINMKDTWVKYNKRIDEHAASGNVSSLKKYAHYDQMIFLKKSFDKPKLINPSDSSGSDSERDDKSEVQRQILKRKSSTPIVTIKRMEEPSFDSRYVKQNLSPDPLSSTSEKPSFVRTNHDHESAILPEISRNVDANDSPIGQRSLVNSRSMHFFRGIAPTVDTFSDENMIEFQYKVLSIVKEIRKTEQK